MAADFWPLVFDVVEPVSVLYAIASGLALGASFLLWLSLRFPLKIPLTTERMALLAGSATCLVGVVFFAGQIVQAYATDPQWPRAFGRAVLWVVFSIALGHGLGIARSFAHNPSDRKGS